MLSFTRKYYNVFICHKKDGYLIYMIYIMSALEAPKISDEQTIVDLKTIVFSSGLQNILNQT